MPVLGDNRYGKAEIRLMKVDRDTERHVLHDLNVSISLSGAMQAVHLEGDNAAVLPTDSQKNTAYAFAREHGIGDIETFAARLALLEDDFTGRGLFDEVLLDDVRGAGIHDGGRVKFGPDGKLYWTMGETGQTYQARISRMNSRVDGVSQQLELEARIERGDGRLLPGMVGTALFEDAGSRR